MARKLIGTGITNSQGIAVMNKDAQGNTISGYTGVGAGKLQIIAEAGDLQSELYEIIDASVRDGGVENDQNNNAFAYTTSVMTIATDSTGTSVTNDDTSSNRGFTVRNPDDNSYVWSGSYVVEVDIVFASEGTRLQLYEDTTNLITRTMGELELTTGGHLRIEYNGTIAVYYVNDVEKYRKTLTLSSYNIRFFLPPLSTFKYKNFLVYRS